jgi:hypothetical protein
MIRRMLRKFLGKSVVQVGAINAFSGIGFSGANLILAWALPVDQYGLIALIVALTNIGIGIGPFGLTGVVNRKLVRADTRLFSYGIVAALVTATGVCLFGYVAYELHIAVLIPMFAAIIAGALTLLAAAHFQNMQRYVIANSLTQFGNIGLALTSIIVLLVGSKSPLLPLYLMALAALVSATWSWGHLFRSPNRTQRRIRYFDWSDAMSMVGIIAASQVLLQLERILIPDLLTLGDLAVFGVMASIVIAPYRSLEMAVAFTLLPHLKATDASHRRQVLAKESSFVTLLACAGGALVYFLAPLLIDSLYQDRYAVTTGLIVAGLVGGLAKVLSSIARAAAAAFCSTRELWILSWFAWASVASGVLGAYYGSTWGVTGIVYGVSIGFVVRGAASIWIALPYYRREDPGSADPKPRS